MEFKYKNIGKIAMHSDFWEKFVDFIKETIPNEDERLIFYLQVDIEINDLCPHNIVYMYPREDYDN